MWGHGGAAAGERGYHWMTFDGPGQQYALYEQGIPFRHDWEAVLTPVLDAMIARADVERERMAVIGVSQGGYLGAARACASSTVSPPPLRTAAWSTSRAPWLAPLTPELRELLEAGRQREFDESVRGDRAGASLRSGTRSSSAGVPTGSRAVPATTCSRPCRATGSATRSTTS